MAPGQAGLLLGAPETLILLLLILSKGKHLPLYRVPLPWAVGFISTGWKWESRLASAMSGFLQL